MEKILDSFKFKINLQYCNEIHFIKELQKIDGLEKLKIFTEKLKTEAKISLMIFLIFFSLCLFFTHFQFTFLSFNFNSKLFFIFLLFVSITFLVNFIAIYISRILMTNYIESFLHFCKSIVKFEDYAKVLMKIKAIDMTFLNESLEKIIQEQDPKLSQVDEQTNPTKYLWDLYLKNKFLYFKSIFQFFEIFFMTKENEEKLFFVFLIEILKIHNIIRNLNSLSYIYNNSLMNLKEKYSNIKIFEKNEEFDEIKSIFEKICEVTINKNKIIQNDDGLIIHVNKFKIFENIIENILEISQNNNLNSHYLELIELILKIREEFRSISNNQNLKDKSETFSNFLLKKEKILKLFETILEKNYSLINVVKQIKLNFCDAIEPIISSPILDNQDKENADSKKNEKINENNKHNPSMMELELPKTNHMDTIQNPKKQMIPVSHFEILKREDDLRRLQMTLISDIEEFQKNKIRNCEEESSAIILESVLDD
jgi:hypothetical protein